MIVYTAPADHPDAEDVVTQIPVAPPSGAYLRWTANQVEVYDGDPEAGAALVSGPHALSSGQRDVTSDRHDSRSAALWVLAKARPSDTVATYDLGVLDEGRDIYSVVLYDSTGAALGTWETTAAVGGGVTKVA